MQCPSQGNKSEDGINAAIDNILADDRREKLVRKRKCENLGVCREPEERDRSKKKNSSNDCKSKHNGVNESKRFSLRVMEALRAIQRQSGCQSKGATICDIVDYVDCNFSSDGDLEAQVRTALKRTCCQGFVKNQGNDTYSLVGPFACQLTKVQDENANKSTPDMTRQNNFKDGCRKKSPRNKNNCRRRTTSQAQESSEIDLSIPTSVEEDLLRQRIEKDMENLEPNDDSNDEALENTINLNDEERMRCSGRNNKIDNGNFDRGNNDMNGGRRKFNLQSRHSSPRKKSPDRDENEIIGAIDDPAQDFEISADLQDFEDDDDNEPLDIPNDPDDDVEPPDEDDEFDDDAKSNDSVLREIKCKSDEKSYNEDKDRELKRWIRNCRRECARRAAIRKD